MTPWNQNSSWDMVECRPQVIQICVVARLGAQHMNCVPCNLQSQTLVSLPKLYSWKDAFYVFNWVFGQFWSAPGPPKPAMAGPFPFSQPEKGSPASSALEPAAEPAEAVRSRGRSPRSTSKTSRPRCHPCKARAWHDLNSCRLQRNWKLYLGFFILAFLLLLFIETPFLARHVSRCHVKMIAPSVSLVPGPPKRPKKLKPRSRPETLEQANRKVEAHIYWPSQVGVSCCPNSGGFLSNFPWASLSKSRFGRHLSRSKFPTFFGNNLFGTKTDPICRLCFAGSAS